MGLYGSAHNGQANERFHFFDEAGNEVTEAASSNALTALMDSVSINNHLLVKDHRSGAYFYSLPETLRGGGTLNVRFTARPKDAGKTYTFALNGTKADAGGNVVLPNVQCVTPYTLEVYDGDAVAASVKVQFTFLPIVELTANVSELNLTEYKAGTLHLQDPSLAADDSLTYIKIRYRGATAAGFPKKAFAIKTVDATGKSLDKSYLGMREDNNWILDAASIDGTLMRNRVATDLWNEFSTKPYHYEQEKGKPLTGTRGRFVEVFLNGSYHGLYCLTEKIDRKQLKLKKWKKPADGKPAKVLGALYKADQWSYEVFMGHSVDRENYGQLTPAAYDNANGLEAWQGFEVKYPDFEDETVDWAPLWNAVNFVAKSDDNTFYSLFDKYFDRPVVDDYFLFCELLLATDNHGKNMHYFVYDKTAAQHADKLGIAVWDLDGTFGIRWDGSKNLTSDPRQDWVTFIKDNEHGELTYFYRMNKIANFHWQDALKARYCELRATSFNPEALAKRFEDYGNLFVESNAYAREEKRWGTSIWQHNDGAGNVDYAKEWIKARVEYLDEKYGYDPTGISVVAQGTPSFSVRGGKGDITVRTSAPQSLGVFSLSGQRLRTVSAKRGTTTVKGLAAGVYLVGNQKVIVE